MRESSKNLFRLRILSAVLGLMFAGQSLAQPVTHVAAGADHVLFTESGGSLWGMGGNVEGQLGLGPLITETNIPQEIVSSGIGQIAAGGYHSLFQEGHTLWAMGDNEYGELGDGTSTTYQFYPEEIFAVVIAESIAPIAAGEYHSLFGTYYNIVAHPGGLWAMGYNLVGQLGDGTQNNTNKPEEVLSVPVGNAVSLVSGGWDHTLFTKPGGSLWGTGGDGFGQLGDGIYTGFYTTLPLEIVSSNVTAIAAGFYFSYFCKSDGSLWAMGWNRGGELGDGTTNDSHVPELIVSSNVVAVTASREDWFGLFIKSDGSLWGMGDNSHGQLGVGTTNNSLVPEMIVSGNVVAVAAGGSFSVFIKSDGSLWGMGGNSVGQLGVGDYTNRYWPVEIISPPPSPTITGISLSGTNVVVLWPTNAVGFYLQSASNLTSPAAWSFLSYGQGVVGGQNVVTNPVTGSQQFYRLSGQ
jgi:alpha-tubulin suppressor-like RCC1 family protein